MGSDRSIPLATAWPRAPVIYEINTWTWLSDLSRQHGRAVTLASVPAAEWDALAAWPLDAVWFMGVWERSPTSAAIAHRNEALVGEFRRVLPDYRPEDNIGSAYAVRRYRVDARLGGQEGLAGARAALAERGIRILLDFVPNHLAIDHPWVSEHPEYFVEGTREDLQRSPEAFVEAGGRVFACGRDPYFPPWADVIQVNAFHPGQRRAAIETLHALAAQCDGVRCDMAMLLMNDIFAEVWGARVGAPPSEDYWVEVIGAVRSAHPEFLFVAEAYWDRERALQEQGFDYCYDKRLLDHLLHGTAPDVRRHLAAAPGHQDRLVRFIENHDEQRAHAAFGPSRERAAAVVMATVPGARLFHEGQFEGRAVRVPVFLARRPEEQPDEGLLTFYRALLETAASGVVREGVWALATCRAKRDEGSVENPVAWCWRCGERRLVVVVNLSGDVAHARVRLPWDDVQGAAWWLTDVFSGGQDAWTADPADAIVAVDLPPWGARVFDMRRAG